jgi:hypothetical protein
MGPGGYRFTDYVKIGLPLTLIVMLVCVWLLPVLWSAQALARGTLLGRWLHEDIFYRNRTVLHGEAPICRMGPVARTACTAAARIPGAVFSAGPG